ncbi:hypothetical protein CRUP_015240 [Coryphaenoides rupestris]|nr:hypothetical protein CRUP_015240 [Coryphaenoides rupestris]
MSQQQAPQPAPHPVVQPLPQLTATSGGPPAPQQQPHQHPQHHHQQQQQQRPAERQELSASTETLTPVELPPQPIPYAPSGTLRSVSPKPDPTEVYRKSRAMLESKPVNTKELDVFIKRNQESGFGFRVLGGEGPDQPGKSHKQVLDLMTNAARNGQDEAGPQQPQQVASALVNGSPRMPRGAAEATSGTDLPNLPHPTSPSTVIPHKIGRIIEGSPTDRTGQMKVGDRISAVNGRSIMDLSHNDIVQLIKEAGNSVTLTVVPEDGVPSSFASERASIRRRVNCRSVPPLPACSPTPRNGHGEDKREGHGWPEYKTLPARETPGAKQGCFVVGLERGPRGFGFSLRGGKEYNMGLFILRLAEDGPALRDGRIHV